MRKILLFCLVFFMMFVSTVSAEEVRVLMSWHPYQEYIPFIVAKDKGFYKEVGLDVEVLPGTSSTHSIQMVSMNKVDFALAAGPNVLMAADKGINIISVMSVYEKTPHVIYYKKSSGIKTPQDIVGKKILIAPKSSKGVVTKAFLRQYGLDGKVQEIVSTGLTVDSEPNMLIHGQTDLFTGVVFASKHRLEKMIPDLDWFTIADHNISFVYECLIVEGEYLKNNEGRVRRFVQATRKGYEYAMDNTDEAVEIFYKTFPEYKRLEIEKSIDLNFQFVKDNKTDKVGYTHLKNWISMKKMLIDAKMISDKVDVNKVFTNKYIQ